MVDRKDIEAKLREIETGIEDARQTVKDRAVLAAAGAVGLVLLSFLWGRRKGRKGGAVVEVYKVR